MSCRGIWPREATPTTVTTVQAAHAAIARYVAGGPTMSWVGWGVSVRKDQGPRCPGSGPMIVCTAPPTIGLAIMLRRGSLPPTPCIEASLMAHSPPLSRDRPTAVVASQLCTSASVHSQEASSQRMRHRHQHYARQPGCQEGLPHHLGLADEPEACYKALPEGGESRGWHGRSSHARTRTSGASSGATNVRTLVAMACSQVSRSKQWGPAPPWYATRPSTPMRYRRSGAAP